MTGAVSEENAVRNDGSATSAGLEHPYEKGQEKELRLLGLGDGKEGLAHSLVVQAAGEGRIGEAQGIAALVGVVGGEAVTVGDIRIIDTVEHQVHGTNPEHRGVGVEAVQHAALVMVGIFPLEEFFLVMGLDVLGTFHDEARTAHGRVANGVLQLRIHELHHHPDNVTRSAELTVVARSRHLPEDVLIDIAHRVPVVHVQGVNAFHDLDQRARRLDEEGCIGHELAVGRLLSAAQVLDEGEHVTAHGPEHLLGLHVLEDAPPEVAIRDIAVCIGVMPHAHLEGRVLHGGAEHAGVGLLGPLRVVEHLHKEQIGHLLQDGNGIGDTSRPEGVPYLVDTCLYLTRNHRMYRG